MSIDTQKLREALDQIEGALHDTYQNAGQECCGHGQGGECCGNPEPVWDAADQKIMDVLGPIQRVISGAVSQADAQAAEIARLRDALRPFANEADDYDSGGADPLKVHRPVIYRGAKTRYTLGDLRRARAALQESSHG